MEALDRENPKGGTKWKHQARKTQKVAPDGNVKQGKNKKVISKKEAP